MARCMDHISLKDGLVFGGPLSSLDRIRLSSHGVDQHSPRRPGDPGNCLTNWSRTNEMSLHCLCLFTPSICNIRLEGEDARSSPSPTPTKGMDDQGGQEQTNAKKQDAISVVKRYHASHWLTSIRWPQKPAAGRLHDANKSDQSGG